MNHLTKEWKNKLAFLKDELQYIYIKLKNLNIDISKPEDYSKVELFTEQVRHTLSEVNAQADVLNSKKVTESNEAIFRDSLESYERIREIYDELIKNDDLLEAV